MENIKLLVNDTIGNIYDFIVLINDTETMKADVGSGLSDDGYFIINIKKKVTK